MAKSIYIYKCNLETFLVVCPGCLDQFIHIFISLELMRYESRTGFNEIQGV